jgi:hypothetical protein
MVGPSQFRTAGGRAPAAATTRTEFTGGLERPRIGAYDRPGPLKIGHTLRPAGHTLSAGRPGSRRIGEM